MKARIFFAAIALLLLAGVAHCFRYALQPNAGRSSYLLDRWTGKVAIVTPEGITWTDPTSKALAQENAWLKQENNRLQQEVATTRKNVAEVAEQRKANSPKMTSSQMIALLDAIDAAPSGPGLFSDLLPPGTKVDPGDAGRLDKILDEIKAERAANAPSR